VPAACCIVSQSDWLPMIMPTVRLGSLIVSFPDQDRKNSIIGGEALGQAAGNWPADKRSAARR
jgi:hypothetical protein